MDGDVNLDMNVNVNVDVSRLGKGHRWMMLKKREGGRVFEGNFRGEGGV